MVPVFHFSLFPWVYLVYLFKIKADFHVRHSFSYDFFSFYHYKKSNPLLEIAITYMEPFLEFQLLFAEGKKDKLSFRINMNTAYE